MSTIGAIAGAVEIGLKLLEKYINDPARLDKAKREYFDDLSELKEKIHGTTDAEELDRLLLNFIDRVHSK